MSIAIPGGSLARWGLRFSVDGLCEAGFGLAVRVAGANLIRTS